jgi:arginase
MAGSFSLVGIPFDLNSSYLRGPAKAPPLIREALHCDASNSFNESGRDLSAGIMHDAGDLELAETTEEAFPVIEESISHLLAQGRPVISLGGDHSITYPIIRAFSRKFTGLTILHFDAHPDLYDELQGNRFSHACPFARIMEERLVGRLVQVGIRTMNRHQQEQAQRFGVEVIEMKNLSAMASLSLSAPLYLSFDMDVLDPAFAPGVSHWEPGGMSVREAISFLQGIPVPLAGADIVEFNPERDASGRTAMVCAKILREIAELAVR